MGETLIHFLDRLKQQASQGAPDCLFLNSSGEIESRLSLSEWLEKGRKIAAFLKSQGIQPNDRVLVTLPTSPEFLQSLIACWELGAIPVPCPDPLMGVQRGNILDRLSKIVEDCAPSLCLISAQTQEFLQQHPKITDGITLPLVALPSVLPQAQTPGTPHPIAWIQYTSGSTGTPKGVVVTHANLLANIRAMEGRSKMDPQDRHLTWMPLYHDMGLVGGVFYPVYVGAQPYFLSPLSFLASPANWLACLSRYQITSSTAPNFAYNLCAKRIRPETIPNLDLSHWKLAYNGAEPIQLSTLEAFEKVFSPFGFSKTTHYPVYGMAEATLGIAFPHTATRYQVDWIDRDQLIQKQQAVAVAPGSKDGFSSISVGSCLPGHSIQIQDPETQQVLEDRHVGEICFAGPSVSPGYYQELSRSRTAPGAPPPLRTGDLGYLAQGQLYVVDRLKDLIKIAGRSYYPTDIEQTCHNLEGLRPNRMIAFEIPQSESGTSQLVVVAEVAERVDPPTSGIHSKNPKKDPHDLLKSLRRQVKERIHSTFGLIPEVLFVTQKTLPLTSSGKLMRKKCKDLYLKGQLKTL